MAEEGWKQGRDSAEILQYLPDAEFVHVDDDALRHRGVEAFNGLLRLLLRWSVGGSEGQCGRVSRWCAAWAELGVAACGTEQRFHATRAGQELICDSPCVCVRMACMHGVCVCVCVRARACAYA